MSVPTLTAALGGGGGGQVVGKLECLHACEILAMESRGREEESEGVVRVDERGEVGRGRGEGREGERGVLRGVLKEQRLQQRGLTVGCAYMCADIMFISLRDYPVKEKDAL